MLSEMLKSFAYSPGRAVFLLSVLALKGRLCADTNCTSLRCLAETLINTNLTSQPQDENCLHYIYVPFIEYQTVSIDTKSLLLNSQLKATLVWNDPDLKWNTSLYNYTKVVVPVKNVWTPELYVTNGLKTTIEDSSSDLLVYSNGTIMHTVIISAEVNCAVNLFNYPFAADACPVAIQTWYQDGCGTQLVFGELKTIDSSHGDWQTDDAFLLQFKNNQNYILVFLTMKSTNPFITLMLPSILIVLADVVSFALPLGSGERNGFKVTLVLSFTMFLSILNDQLPGDSQCSPIIRVHFCVCLVLLVLSMLVSLVLTRVAKDGRFIFYFCCKGPVSRKTGNKEDDEGGISVTQLKGSEEDSRMLRKVVKFLEALDAKELESERYERIANTIDTVFFWFYFSCGTLYFCAMMYVMVRHTCPLDHFDFWE